METIGQILTATVGVIERVGVHNLTIDLVAAEAGVSKGGVLHHFPTKTALIVAAISQDMETLMMEIDETAGSTVNFASALAQFARRIALEEGGVSPAFLVTAAEIPEAASVLATMFSTLVERANKDGKAGSIDSTLVLFASYGILISLGMKSFQPSAEQLATLFEKLDSFAAKA
ncbi:TetR/AcrR family transcriptional regulator [Labrys sp. KB_33_2]|jgi:AcrR family transcriptional regulator|uniref:TetR/AcrR family transcriptional regulator n=1 Tax=unclassified Labrys (in: a-proteobacteria) TaxID=2688601 RepID=UPI003EC08B6E